MSSDRSMAAALVIANLLWWDAGCAGFRRGDEWQADTGGAVDTDGTGTGGTAGTGSGISFSDDVYPRLVDGCQGCHSPGGTAGTTAYLVTEDIDETYEATVDIVDLDAPRDSRLLRKARGDGHGGGAVFEPQDEDYETIATWIEQGAQP